MKGLVFIELVDFVEQRFGSVPGVPPAGTFNALASYDHQELSRIIAAASAPSGVGAGEMLRTFGVHLFGRFAALYPVFFFEADSALGFLGGIETYIHGEVQKLYPGAEFPSFECRSAAPGQLEMVYRSARPFADLAEGLILGCVAHFREAIDVRREDLAGTPGTAARFTLRAKAETAAGAAGAEGG
jgi:hypothetical protein